MEHETGKGKYKKNTRDWEMNIKFDFKGGRERKKNSYVWIVCIVCVVCNGKKRGEKTR